MPGKELLGRYDMYPNPRGQESLSPEGGTLPAPTTAPSAPGDLEVPGTIMRRLWTKTNSSGADDILDIRTQKNKDQIRNLRLRKNITGSVKRARRGPEPEHRNVNSSETLTLSQAV